MNRTIRCMATLAIAGALTPSLHATDSVPPATIYASPNGVPLKLYAFQPEQSPDKARAAILLFHSGGWVRGKPDWLFPNAREFAARGLVAIPVQYRLSVDGVTPIDALTDTCSAFRWVRTHATQLNIDPHRVAGYGASAGGQLVAAAATVGCPAANDAPSGKPDALILFSAGVDAENSPQFRALAGPQVNPADYSPLAHVGADTPPTLIVHGAEDSVTHAPASEKFCTLIKTAGGYCRLHVFPGLGHLLTRKLDDQRTSIDADPDAIEAAQHLQDLFLVERGFADAR